MTPFTTARSAFFGGVRAFATVILGVIPFGLIYGVAASDVGFSFFEGVGMSVIMVAGAAQLVAIELLKTGAPVWVIIFSAWVVNLRFVIYSASIAPHFKGLSLWWKFLLSYFLTDQPYALSISYYNDHPDAPFKNWYYLGVSTSMWVMWISTCALGLIVGSVIPTSWSLSLVIPIMFMGLAIPTITSRAHLGAGLVAVLIALVAAPLPNNLGLILAVVCGMATGVLLEKPE